MLKESKFLFEKLEGVREMKGRCIDITCKTRRDLLELYAILRKVEHVYNLGLYESDQVHILIGWVPVPMTNENIYRYIQFNYGNVVKVFDKRHRDGLRSAVRIVVMKRNTLQMKPLPSYIYIDGCTNSKIWLRKIQSKLMKLEMCQI